MFLRAPTVALCILLSPFAALTADRVSWTCALSADLVRLVCVANVDPAGAPTPFTVTAIVNGTRFPLDTRRTYTVELWSAPTELAFVEELARSTICYRSPSCDVTVTAPSLTAIASSQ